MPNKFVMVPEDLTTDMLIAMRGPKIANAADAWRAAIAAAPSPWIPVAERLPTKEDATNYAQVLAYWPDTGEIQVADYRRVIYFYIEWNVDRTLKYWSHWMPLPGKPE